MMGVVAGAMPLVGRDREMEHARALLQRVTGEGQGRLLLVAGEPGIGKSRLVREIITVASEARFRSLVGRCFEQYITVPWVAFSEALGSAFATAPSRLRSRLLAQRPEIGVLLPDLTPASRQPPGVGDELQLRAFRAAEELMRAIARREPLVLVLEDLQWADSASLGLLLHLGRHLSDFRLVIVATYRDIELPVRHPLSNALRELRREQVVDEITLRGLPLQTTREFVASFLGTNEVAEQFVDLVHARTSGNPFFIGEVLKSVVEQGIENSLSWKEDAERRPVHMQVPSSVRAVVHQRVERLPPATQSLLDIASVLGHEFDIRVLAYMADETVDAVLEVLEPALARNLLVQRGSVPVQRFAFVHVLAQHALYDTIAAQRARGLHARAAEALQRVYGDRPQVAADLARHFQLAGDLDQARAFALRAGQHAASQYAHVEAIANYQIARDIAEQAGDHPQFAELERRIADELHELDRPADAQAGYDRALAAYERLGDAFGQARVHRALAWLHQIRFDFASAEPHLTAALQLWPHGAEQAEYAVLLLDAGRARAFETNFESAEQLVARGRQIAEQVADSSLLARALLETGVLRASQGFPPSEVEELYNRAETLARSTGSWPMLLRVHLNRGGARLSSGDLAGYRREAAQALRIGVKFVQARGPASYLAEACLLLGDWREGRRAARIACAPGRIMTPAHTALLAWMEGDAVRALQLLRDAVEEARPTGALQYVVQYLGMFADGALQIGRNEQAAEAAQQSAAIVREHGYWGQLEYAFGPLGEALALTGDSAVDDVLEETAALLGRYHIERPRPQLLRARGIVLYRRGNTSAAIDRLHQSAELARGQRARIELGRSLALLEAAARAEGRLGVADAAAVERAAIVRFIGPEVGGLNWSGGEPVLAAPLANDNSRHSSPLTRREQEVARLVARGLTNKQIAEALVIAEGTAGIHVDHILNKLGFHSRAQVAAWIGRSSGRPDI